MVHGIIVSVDYILRRRNRNFIDKFLNEQQQENKKKKKRKNIEIKFYSTRKSRAQKLITNEVFS